MCKVKVALSFVALIVALSLARPALAQDRRLVVSPQGPYTAIQDALADARDGDTIEVRAGAYHGPVRVTKRVTLQGVGRPSVDNGGDGTVITLLAQGAAVIGFDVRGSGVEPDQDHAGITLAAPHTQAIDNRLSDVLFGIFVAKAPGAVVRGNDITSKQEYDVGRKGDGIRLWYSAGALVEDNIIHETRDVVIWYSENVIIRGNTIERGRYGVHLMYCNRAVIERNRLIDNSVGVYSMNSDDAVLRENYISGQRGPSGYALGFKDTVNVDVRGNVLVDNRAGIFLDGTPFGPGYARFISNTLAFNDVGVIVMTNAKGYTFTGNMFWENAQQVAIQGSGNPGKSNWDGNFWSDYTGFDANGDGLGDVPYQSERVFENLTDRVPELRALIFSPAVQAVEFAGSAFPLMRPQPKLIDAQPMAQPAPLPAFTQSAQPNPLEMVIVAALLTGLCGLIAIVALTRAGTTMQTGTKGMTNEATERSVMLRVTRVSKRYGKAEVLRVVSFDAAPGEALALWGPNGAGKTTLVKAILGLIDYAGEINVGDFETRRKGKQARRLIGYVPQEAIFYDWTVRATMSFYATLKKADQAQIIPLLTRMGLTEHAHKPVPALSGGLKQRLALAVALLGNPPMLLLDEPMANLDAQTRAEYRALLAALRREGKTILFSSHRLDEVESLADRVLVLEQGQLKAILTPHALRMMLNRDLDMALWMPEAQRAQALDILAQQGVHAHMNGRGTVVARIGADGKLHLLRLLAERGIQVADFDIELGKSDAQDGVK